MMTSLPGKRKNGARACQGAGPAEECCQAGHLGLGGFDRGGEGLVFFLFYMNWHGLFLLANHGPPQKTCDSVTMTMFTS